MAMETGRRIARGAGLVMAGALLGGIAMLPIQAAPGFKGHLVANAASCIPGFTPTKPNKAGIYSCVSRKLRCRTKAYDVQHPNGLVGGRYKYHCVPMNKL